jgi:quaternary ammonium compound-resistance protein SugE
MLQSERAPDQVRLWYVYRRFWDDPGISINQQGRPAKESYMSWLILLLAGLLEVIFAVGLKFSEGFTKPLPSVATATAMAASFYLLSIALRSLPFSTAYSIWVGIGVVGSAAVGFMVFQESLSALKATSLALLVAGVVGVKLSSAA